MKNKDTNKTALQAFRQDFRDGLENKDLDKVTQAFETYSQSLVDDLADAANEFKQTADQSVLTARGIRTLTSAEQKFYTDFAETAKARDPKQALTGLDLTIPETVIDTVIADIQNDHPLLSYIDMTNTYGKVKWVMAEDKRQLAQWGALTTAITQQLSGKIKEIEFGTNKLTAYVVVPKDLIALGASYIDAYVRTILSDALAVGMEYGAIRGTGKNMPIGMIRDLDVSGTEPGTYAEKAAVTVTSFDINSYMALVAQLATKPAAEGETVGRPRAIRRVGLIVNPTDALTKITPATTVLATDGTYSRNVFPFPTELITCEELQPGEAIMGVMGENYLDYKMFLSSGYRGNVEYSDEYQFLEDNRVYTIKLFGTGRPVDNNCFIKLDITGLQPRKFEVSITEPVATIETDARIIGATLNKTTVAADDTATVTVTGTNYNVLPATAPTVAYLWQVRAKTGTTWADLTSAYTGYNTDTLTVKAADAEKHYRCKVTVSGSATGTVYTDECTVEAGE